MATVIPEIGLEDEPISPVRRDETVTKRNPKTMMIGPIVNAAWGFGTALIYRVFIPR